MTSPNTILKAANRMGYKAEANGLVVTIHVPASLSAHWAILTHATTNERVIWAASLGVLADLDVSRDDVEVDARWIDSHWALDISIL